MTVLIGTTMVRREMAVSGTAMTLRGDVIAPLLVTTMVRREMAVSGTAMTSRGMSSPRCS
jgi:hypothetical protein